MNSGGKSGFQMKKIYFKQNLQGHSCKIKDMSKSVSAMGILGSPLIISNHLKTTKLNTLLI